MKHFIPFVIALLCFGCSGGKTTANNNQALDSDFGNQLIAADFLMYADSLTIDDQKEQLRNSFNIYDERNYKILHVDGEELAEFNFDFFLPRLNEILGKRNFHLEVKPTDNYETSHEVFLNGEKIQLYTDQEFEKGDSWNKASGNFFKKLNELLKKQHLKESFFLLYSDNDLEAILLTDKQLGIILERYKDEKDDVPYKPSN